MRQRIEMQIPEGNIYSPVSTQDPFDGEFKKLSNYYDVRDEEKLKCFIRKHEHILEYIHELTPLINEYFPNHHKHIEFCEDPEFSDLDFVMIYIECSIYEQDKQTLKQLKDEDLYMSKYSKNIRGLVSVELW